MKFKELYAMAPLEIKAYLNRLKEAKQNSTWHPEGDSLVHTIIVVDRVRKHFENKKLDMNLLLAALFHDLGKADTTKKNDKGEWSAYGHEAVSTRLVEKHKDWIQMLGADFDEVLFIVKQHMRVKYLDKMKRSKVKELQGSPYYKNLELFTKFDDMRNVTTLEIHEAMMNAF